MGPTTHAAAPATTAAGHWADGAAWVGLLTACGLMVTAMVVPWAAQWNVHVFSFPPLHAAWAPRVGPGTLPTLVLAVVGSLYATRLAAVLTWGRLLGVTYATGVAWLACLATVDGWDGIGQILDTDYEYLNTARSVTDISATLHEYISRIPYSSPENWPVHIAGHPPGALLFFVGLVRLDLGSGLAAGWVLLLAAASTPLAVLVTLRRLGATESARTVAPFLVLGPAALWMAVSADSLFAAVGAWGLCCLAIAATATTRLGVAAWGVGAGLLLGYCVMLSYGMPLLGLLAVAVLVVARRWSPLPWAVGTAIAVVVAVAFAGFAWWEAYPVLRERYWDGVASRRPTTYWLWGNVAALCFSAGPVVGAAAATTVRGWAERVRGRAWPLSVVGKETRTVLVITGAALATVAVADLSLMSKAEVERIWLPFVPWLLVGTALLPASWRRPALVGQIALAVVAQHLLSTGW